MKKIIILIHHQYYYSMNLQTINNTLLGNIPNELLTIINFNIDEIIIKRNEKIMETHK